MTSSTISSSTCCLGSSSNCHKDWVRSRISPPAGTSATDIATNPAQPITQSFSNNSCLGGVFLRKEPLKIGLYSDDSSIGSCDSESDDGFDDNDVNHFQKRICRIEETSNNISYDRNFVRDTCSTPSIVSSESASSTSSGNSTTSITKSPCISRFSSFNRESGDNHLCNSDSNSLKRKRRSNEGYGRRGSKRSVSLDQSVSVIPIPSRTEYSCQVRERIWSSSEELFANAARNSVEFASEGWNWRQVVEDERMLVHKPTGELIHPIHLHNALACIKQEDKSDQPITTNDEK